MERRAWLDGQRASIEEGVEYRGLDVIPMADGMVAGKDVYSGGVTLLRRLGLTEI